ncbi:MAG: ORF6N domain-containing protein [Bacteroidota bacterium]
MNKLILKETQLATQIHFIRGEQVMLDFDLAALYGVETKVLKQTVKRNIERFPEDFMFELTIQELTNLRSQIVTSSWGGIRYQPFAFTEQGVAMLSGILKSERAIEVNIAIMRTFVQLRKLMSTNDELAKKINDMEKKYDEQFHVIFEAIKQLIVEENKPRKAIGFRK